jgi:Tol biopolymer transport system component
MNTLQWVDPTGKRDALLAKPGFYSNPILSTDGKRLVLLVTEGGSTDVWVYDPQRDATTRLTFGGAQYFSPVWTPDSQHIVFASRGNIFLASAGGASQPQALLQSQTLQVPWSFTPDGKRLAFMELGGTAQIWTVPLEDQASQLKPASNWPSLAQFSRLAWTPASTRKAGVSENRLLAPQVGFEPTTLRLTS